jgi:TIR domain
MRKGLSAERELFILHASEERDARFVQTDLVPSLGLPRHQLLLSSSLPPGRTFLDAIEHALATSRVTLLIISPAFLREAWSLFGELLAVHHAISGGLLVPLLIADCALPWRLDLWVRLDFRDRDDRAAELARLRDLLRLPAAASHPLPSPSLPTPPALPSPVAADSTSALLLEDQHLEPVWRLTFDLSRPRALMLALVTTLVLTVRSTDPGATPVPALSQPLADVQLRCAPRPLPATPRCPSSTHIAAAQCAAPLSRSPASPLALLPPAPFW